MVPAEDPSTRLSSAAVEVTPSKMLSSAAVDETAVPLIDNVTGSIFVARRSLKTSVTVAPAPVPLNLTNMSLPLGTTMSFEALYVPWKRMRSWVVRLFRMYKIFSALFGVS